MPTCAIPIGEGSRRPRFISGSEALTAKERLMRKALVILSSVFLLVAATPKKPAASRTDWKNVEQAISLMVV
jgi:hypothetical protein